MLESNLSSDFEKETRSKEKAENFPQTQFSNHNSVESTNRPLWLELVDGRCRVQSSVALVDLGVRSFSWFFSETRVNTGQDTLENPLGGHSPIVLGP